MLSEFPTKHASNIPVTFVTLKRFAVLFFLPSCCVNSLINGRMMKETNSTFPPSLIPILTLPAPLSPLTTMDWFLVSRSLLISQNAFCPTANIWGGSSLIDMDKSKNNEKYHFMMGDVFVMKANEKKVKNERKMELFYMGTDLSGLPCLCLWTFQFKLTLNHPQMFNFTIFIFPPHFSSFNNFKMIKMPQNFLIKLNLWWDYSLFYAQRKKFAAIRESNAKNVRWGGKRRGSLFPTTIPFPRSPTSSFCLTFLFWHPYYYSECLAQASGTMKGKLLNYEFKIACEQELIYLGQIVRAAHQSRC